jgi:hypothetical protein
MKEDIEYRPVVIPKATYDMLLKEEECLGLIALYNFYYYTAVWQLTNQPHATTDYAAKGLHTSTKKIRKWKRILSEIGLIREKKKYNQKGQIEGCFIQVRYYTTLTENQRVVSVGGNAYSNNSKIGRGVKNTHDGDKNNKKFQLDVPTDDLNKFDKKYAIKLEEAIRLKRKIFRKVNIHQWTKHLQKLRIEDGIKKKRLKEVLNWYILHFGEKYVPQIYSAESFREKFLFVEDAKKRIEGEEPEQIEITPTAKKVVQRLNEYLTWPKGSDNQLSTIVQKSLDNYQVFLEKHRAIKKKTLFIKYLKEGSYINSPEDFIFWWMGVISLIKKIKCLTV